jgi:hypothetical protein
MLGTRVKESQGREPGRARCDPILVPGKTSWVPVSFAMGRLWVYEQALSRIP